MAIIKKTMITNIGVDVEKRNLLHIVNGIISQRILKKLMWNDIWSSNSTSGIISKGNKNTNLKTYLNPMFIEALFTIA